MTDVADTESGDGSGSAGNPEENDEWGEISAYSFGDGLPKVSFSDPDGVVQGELKSRFVEAESEIGSLPEIPDNYQW